MLLLKERRHSFAPIAEIAQKDIGDLPNEFTIAMQCFLHDELQRNFKQAYRSTSHCLTIAPGPRASCSRTCRMPLRRQPVPPRPRPARRSDPAVIPSPAPTPDSDAQRSCPHRPCSPSARSSTSSCWPPSRARHCGIPTARSRPRSTGSSLVSMSDTRLLTHACAQTLTRPSCRAPDLESSCSGRPRLISPMPSISNVCHSFGTHGTAGTSFLSSAQSSGPLWPRPPVCRSAIDLPRVTACRHCDAQLGGGRQRRDLYAAQQH